MRELDVSLLGVDRLVARFNLMSKKIPARFQCHIIQPVINVIKPKYIAMTERDRDSISELNSSSSKGEDMRRNAKKKRYPVVEEYLQAEKKCKKQLRTLIYEYRCAPILLYLAWYNVNETTGKPFGTFTHQFTDENIEKAKKLLQALNGEGSPFKILSEAEIYQLAGAVAVEVAGGPDVAFHPGREDNTQNMPPHDIGTKDSIVGYPREVVIDSRIRMAIFLWLRCNKDCSGFQFTWPPNSYNSYFKEPNSVTSEESLPSMTWPFVWILNSPFLSENMKKMKLHSSPTMLNHTSMPNHT